MQNAPSYKLGMVLIALLQLIYGNMININLVLSSKMIRFHRESVYIHKIKTEKWELSKYLKCIFVRQTLGVLRNQSVTSSVYLLKLVSESCFDKNSDNFNCSNLNYANYLKMVRNTLNTHYCLQWPCHDVTKSGTSG